MTTKEINDLYYIWGLLASLSYLAPSSGYSDAVEEARGILERMIDENESHLKNSDILDRINGICK